jgi:ppGpp synthetase/RelA/SpoT-type nucleotidyltranferase
MSYLELLHEELEIIKEKVVVTNTKQPWGDVNTEEELEDVYLDIMTKYKDKVVPALHRMLKRAIPSQKNKILMDIKSFESFSDKVINRGKKSNKIHDIFRSAILVSNNDEVEKTVKALSSKSRLLSLDRKEKGDDSEYGYYGSVHFKIEVKGVIVEVQVMTKRLHTLKRVGHDIYKKWRSIEDFENDPDFKSDQLLSKRIFKRANTPLQESNLSNAISIATDAHKGQYRKGGDGSIEFITHPKEVSIIGAKLAKKYNVDSNVISIASVLHDTIEDTSVTYKYISVKFSKEVADIVQMVTNNPKRDYMVFIKDIIKNGSKEALVVKIADITHNMSTGKGIIDDEKYALWGKSLSLLKSEISKR